MARAQSMALMLEQVDQKYGHIDNYIEKELDYTKEEIEQMRANLRGSAS
jgi:hypothetical protein